MQKVVDYKLADSDTAQGLETAVKQLMQDGWVPSGPVVAFQERLIQAVVKFEAA